MEPTSHIHHERRQVSEREGNQEDLSCGAAEKQAVKQGPPPAVLENPDYIKKEINIEFLGHEFSGRTFGLWIREWIRWHLRGFGDTLGPLHWQAEYMEQRLKSLFLWVNQANDDAWTIIQAERKDVPEYSKFNNDFARRSQFDYELEEGRGHINIFTGIVKEVLKPVKGSKTKITENIADKPVGTGLRWSS